MRNLRDNSGTGSDNNQVTMQARNPNLHEYTKK